MQYDLKETLKEKTLIALTWHGIDTMVLLDNKDARKTPVKTGETVSVSLERARQLFTYSPLWTLEGDEPVEHGFFKARAAANEAALKKVEAKAKKKAVKKAEKAASGTQDDPVDLSPQSIKKMKREELVAALTAFEDVDEASLEGVNVPELKEMLLKKVEETSADAEEIEEPDAEGDDEGSEEDDDSEDEESEEDSDEEADDESSEE